MDIETIKKAGLNESQSKCYLSLVQNGSQSANDLVLSTGENRTNAYAIANKLVELKLAIKNDDKTTTYSAAHPSQLEALAEKRRKIITKNEQDIKRNISSLIDTYYLKNELPGSRTIEGIEGLRFVNNDILKDKNDVYIIRNKSDYMPEALKEEMKDYREKKAANGIHTYAITPKTERAVRRKTDGTDAKTLYHRSFLPKESYQAPVKISVYGDKTTFCAYGNTQIATIINNPPIAQAMREIIVLLSEQLDSNNNG